MPLFTEPASVQLHDAHPAARAPSIDVCDLFDEPPGPLTEAFVETAVDVTRSAVSLVPGAERLV